MSSRDYSYSSFADTLLTFAKNLIIKNETRAEEGETTDSFKNARRYLIACENTDTFETYDDWTKEELLAVGIDKDTVENILSGRVEVPSDYKAKLLKNRRISIITSYTEMNDYYRMLNGLPNYGETDIMTSYGKTITELNDEELFHLQQGELEELKKIHPRAEYLNHLGDKRVDFYTARTAKNYEILSYKKYILEEDQAVTFIALYYENRRYIVMTNYSKAFADMYYYDAFISLLIVFMTMQRFINEQYNYAIRKDYYNINDIKNVFLSYGLPFFSDIPIKYQRNIVKNLNNLLKYKGTDKVLVDIVKLFGFSNVELYKYYLIKDFKRDYNGNPVINTHDLKSSFEVKFAQVPFETTDITQALQQTTLYQKYEEVVEDDPYWGEVGLDSDNESLAVQDFKEEILNMEFNYINTKYLSMNTIFDVTKDNMDLAYFFNLLDTMNQNGNLATMTFISKDIKPSSNSIRLFDAVSALYLLICKKFGFKDNIITSSTGIASIHSFKFNQETQDLLNRIESNAKIYTNDSEVKFNIKKLSDEDNQAMQLSSLLYTRDELVDLYFKNNDYRNFLIKRMDDTEDYLEYKALNEIYKFNMLSDSTINSYGDYKTYSEYLKDNDYELYQYIEDNSQNEKAINLTISNVLYAIEGFVNSYKFDDMFASLSSLSGDIIKSYITRMINIFKAYTVELKKINIYYVFDEKVANRLKMFSVLIKDIQTELGDSLDDYLELMSFCNSMELNQNSKLRDKHLWISLLKLQEYGDMELETAVRNYALKELKRVFDIDMILTDFLDVDTNDFNYNI